MPQLKVQDYYTPTITAFTGALWDATFTLSLAPTYSYGYFVLAADNINLREIVYYHDKVGNTISVRAENRGLGGTTPKQHGTKENCAMKDVAEIFNFFSDNLSQCFNIEKTGGLTVKVWWGTVFYNGAQVTVADTTLTLADNTTNYVKYSFPTNTISFDASNTGNIKAIISTLGGVITSITYKVAKESFIDFTVAITGALPPQSGNAGKSLMTDGTNVSWGTNNNLRTSQWLSLQTLEIDAATGNEVKKAVWVATTILDAETIRKRKADLTYEELPFSVMKDQLTSVWKYSVTAQCWESMVPFIQNAVPTTNTSLSWITFNNYVFFTVAWLYTMAAKVALLTFATPTVISHMSASLVPWNWSLSTWLWIEWSFDNVTYVTLYSWWTTWTISWSFSNNYVPYKYYRISWSSSNDWFYWSTLSIPSFRYPSWAHTNPQVCTVVNKISYPIALSNAGNTWVFIWIQFYCSKKYKIWIVTCWQAATTSSWTIILQDSSWTTLLSLPIANWATTVDFSSYWFLTPWNTYRLVLNNLSNFWLNSYVATVATYKAAFPDFISWIYGGAVNNTNWFTFSNIQIDYSWQIFKARADGITADAPFAIPFWFVSWSPAIWDSATVVPTNWLAVSWFSTLAVNTIYFVSNFFWDLSSTAGWISRRAWYTPANSATTIVQNQNPFLEATSLTA